MSKNNLLLGFILGVLGTFFLLPGRKGARPYPCLSSIGEDLENDKTFAGNELGE
ncbi:hypothetical protein NXX91_09380 [Bacteroides thetaiotaomicron]|nr:hypothetical protein [Bacteroides thetaiotaomicron]